MNITLQTAEQLMTRELISIAPGDSLRQAAALMDKHHVHCLLVPAEPPARCVGIITTKDIVQVLCEGEPALLDQLCVRDAETRPALSVQSGFTVKECIRLMRMSGVRSVPVFDGVQLVGLLSFTDVLRAVAAPAAQ
jgi:CBS domain-containing protein